jgi:hypothetical protein
MCSFLNQGSLVLSFSLRNKPLSRSGLCRVHSATLLLNSPWRVLGPLKIFPFWNTRYINNITKKWLSKIFGILCSQQDKFHKWNILYIQKFWEKLYLLGFRRYKCKTLDSHELTELWLETNMDLLSDRGKVWDGLWEQSHGNSRSGTTLWTKCFFYP